MRLIDADALKQVISSHTYPVQDYYNSRDYGMFWTGGIEKAIDEAPTIDAEPIRHGKWYAYPIAEDICQCSKCYGLRFGASNYCPYCGAKMEAYDETD